jgi:putative tryptophan/tyrosine transport system substrate-binding protein
MNRSKQAGMIKKTIIILLVALALAPVRLAEAQQVKKVPLIGLLAAFSSSNPARIEAFRQGLRDLGYVEGKNIVIQYRWAEGRQSSFPNFQQS